MQSVPQATTSDATEHAGTRVLTRQQADLLPVYEAVERWLHHEPAFLHEDEPEHHLEELALMTISAEWLTRWQPISMHRAMLAGATPDQVADAAGRTVRDVFKQWERWADMQRHSIIAGHPGVAEEEYETVRERFAAAVEGPLAR